MTTKLQRLASELEARRRLPRYFLLAALTDLALYVLFTAVGHRAIELDADSRGLGLIPVFWAVPYVLLTAFGGGLADRFERGAVARIGAALFAVAAAVLARATTLAHLNLGVALVGIGLAGFWPALQAAIADDSGHRTLERNLGTFNVAWSLGKALGFLLGGALYRWLGPEPTLGLVAGFGVAVAAGMPRTPKAGGPRPSLVTETGRSRAERRRWRYLGWIANFGVWGLGATVIHLFPERNHEAGRGVEIFGLVVGTIYVSQTATFYFLRRSTAWHYRLKPFLAAQVVGAGSVVALGLLDLFPLQLLAAAGVGVSLGMGYYASITYSLRTDQGRGKNTGRHEAALGSANFLLPLLGGDLASRTDWTGAPYLVAAVVVLLGLAFQGAWILRSERGAARGTKAGEGTEGPRE